MPGHVPIRESHNIKSNLYFLSRDPVYDEVKPYSLRYVPNGDLPHTNLKPEKYRVEIADMRDFEDSLNFNGTGFGVIHLNSAMAYDDFHDPSKVRGTFFDELRYALKSTFDASEVHIMDYVVSRYWRVREESSDEARSSAKGTMISQFRLERNMSLTNPLLWRTLVSLLDLCHQVCKLTSSAYFSMEGAEKMIRRDMGDRAEALLQGKWRVVKFVQVSRNAEHGVDKVYLSIWKPLKGPLRDWPLAVCSADSVDFDRDAMPGDVVMSKQLVEDVHINYGQDQKWYYLSEQKTTELLIFQSADSDGKYGQFKSAHSGGLILLNLVTGAPHASFQKSSPDDPPRESIDLRAFIFY